MSSIRQPPLYPSISAPRLADSGQFDQAGTDQAVVGIEVDAGRGIEFVLNRGATLRLGQGRT